MQKKAAWHQCSVKVTQGECFGEIKTNEIVTLLTTPKMTDTRKGIGHIKSLKGRIVFKWIMEYSNDLWILDYSKLPS